MLPLGGGASSWGGVFAPGGCFLPGGGLLPGGVCSWGVCFLLGGVCSQGVPGGAPGTATAAGGTHPTGMHSCFEEILELYCWLTFFVYPKVLIKE